MNDTSEKMAENSQSPLHRLPEIICVKKPGEFWIDINNVDIALLAISNNCFCVIARFIRLDIDTEGAVDFEAQASRSGACH